MLFSYFCDNTSGSDNLHIWREMLIYTYFFSTNIPIETKNSPLEMKNQGEFFFLNWYT